MLLITLVVRLLDLLAATNIIHAWELLYLLLLVSKVMLLLLLVIILLPMRKQRLWEKMTSLLDMLKLASIFVW